MTPDVIDSKDDVIASVTIKADIPTSRVRDLLCGLLENNYSSWLLGIDSPTFAPGLSLPDFKRGGKFQSDDYFHSDQIIPTVEGCSIVLVVENPYDEGVLRVTVDRKGLANALHLMSILSPYQFRMLMEENDDADTADVFGQCLVYAEIVFC